MKGSLSILGIFILGVLLSFYNLLPSFLIANDYSIYVLIALMFSVGLGIGYDKEMITTLKKTKLKVMLIPIITLVGTLLGAGLMSVFIPKYDIWECMAVGSGLGYYSLSSIFITQYKGAELGTIALVSNILRELFTIVAAPLLVMWFGKLAPISAAGVASIDTALPAISRYSGPEFVVVALFHGIVLELCIPFLVTFFCWI